MALYRIFKKIGIAREDESPENPMGLDTRVALIPEDVKRLTTYGAIVYVQEQLGVASGYSDQQYINAGAIVQKKDALLQNKDLLIRLKAPSIEDIKKITSYTTLLCMAHYNAFFASKKPPIPGSDIIPLIDPSVFQKRRDSFCNNKINVIAMENIKESVENSSDIVLEMLMDNQQLIQQIVACRFFVFSGVSFQLIPLIRLAVRLSKNGVMIVKNEVLVTETIRNFSKENYALFEEDRIFLTNIRGAKTVWDFNEISKTNNLFNKMILKRSIECLHETGRAGVRFGIKTLQQYKANLQLSKLSVIVLGFGNVAIGAISECLTCEIEKIHIFGRASYDSSTFTTLLETADLIINGISLDSEDKGKVFVITRDHIEKVIKRGAVIIDLIGSGGGAIEVLRTCTFIDKPVIEYRGLYFASLWGWPALYPDLETTEKYSRQITDVLLTKQRLIEGFCRETIGMADALVCGPFIE